jgi:hypothetical protein
MFYLSKLAQALSMQYSDMKFNPSAVSGFERKHVVCSSVQRTHGNVSGWCTIPETSCLETWVYNSCYAPLVLARNLLQENYWCMPKRLVRRYNSFTSVMEIRGSMISSCSTKWQSMFVYDLNEIIMSLIGKNVEETGRDLRLLQGNAMSLTSDGKIAICCPIF